MPRADSVFVAGCDSYTKAAFTATLAAFEQSGAHIVEVVLPGAPCGTDAQHRTAWNAIVSSEVVAALTPQLFAASRGIIEPAVYERARPGTSVTAVDYLAAVGQLRQWQQEATQLFDVEHLDAIVLPSVPLVAPLLVPPCATGTSGATTVGPADMGVNTKVGNMLSLCGVSLPCLAVAAGKGDGAEHICSCLPVGLDVLCKPHCEHSALALGMAFERALKETETLRTSNC
jgi:Asp-tRNA(Asn)/Glu-tRNA(Gln) amidotransferase A subunit family amidase